jgi:hypothetical protein
LSSPITWSSSSSVSAAASVLSDAVETGNAESFEATISVVGTAPTGVVGSLSILVSNDGTNFKLLPGTVQSVYVPNGQTLPFAWNSATCYRYFKVEWTLGSSGDGTLSGSTTFTSTPSSAPPGITWSSATSVSADTSVSSDGVPATGTENFAAYVVATGTSGGLSGNIFILVGNDGVHFSILPGSEQAVLLSSGQSSAFVWSFPTEYLYVALGWAAGSSANGTLSTGTWSFGTASPIPVPTPIPAPNPLPPITGQLANQVAAAYGVDVLCLTDLDPNMGTTVQAFMQDAYHMVSTDPADIFWAANVSRTILALLSKGINPASISSVESTLQAVIQGDERTLSCQVTIVFDGVETLVATINVVPQNGQQFQLVVGIDKASISLLSSGLVGG